MAVQPDFGPVDVTDFTVGAMLRLGLAIRRAVRGVESFEAAANVVVHYLYEHCIGGSGGGGSHGKGGQSTSHLGIIEGVANAEELRDRILLRLRASKTAGLGDEDHHHDARAVGLSPAHIAALREIRDELRLMNSVAR